MRLFRYLCYALLAASVHAALPVSAQAARSHYKIGIIGAGKVGAALGTLWAKAGDDVMFASRHPDDLKDLATKAGPHAKTGTVAEAAAFGDVVLIAVPYSALPQVAKANDQALQGKVVLDASNAVAQRDGPIADDAHKVGIGIYSAKLMPGTHLVRGFDAFPDKDMESQSFRHGDLVAIPLAADDAKAIAVGSDRPRQRVRSLPASRRRSLRRRGMEEEARSRQVSDAAADDASKRYFFGLVVVRPSEVAAVAYAWLYIFSLLMSYYIMRPIRDTMGVAGGIDNLPWLFTGTLVAMIVFNVPFGASARARMSLGSCAAALFELRRHDYLQRRRA